jgi:hypothetical protein
MPKAKAMPARHQQPPTGSNALSEKLNVVPLWQLDIAELSGHNIEARGREEVNRLLQAGWLLLHIYTLKYEENGVWRERPMAILGRPKNLSGQDEEKKRLSGQRQRRLRRQ